MVSAREAFERLREGNLRFAANVRGSDAFLSHTRRAELSMGQQPFATILGCSDSRVPAEIVFDQGLGDLFVIRVAGNIVAPSQVGSVEFAAERYGTRLVLVLGHSQCGAILATLEELHRPAENQSHNLRSIVDRVRPSVEGLLHLELDEDELVKHAVRANIRASAPQAATPRHGPGRLGVHVHDGGVQPGANADAASRSRNAVKGDVEGGSRIDPHLHRGETPHGLHDNAAFNTPISAACYGVELDMGRGTWNDPILERGTRKPVSHHIGRGTWEGLGTGN